MSPVPGRDARGSARLHIACTARNGRMPPDMIPECPTMFRYMVTGALSAYIAAEFTLIRKTRAV